MEFLITKISFKKMLTAFKIHQTINWDLKFFDFLAEKK